MIYNYYSSLLTSLSKLHILLQAHHSFAFQIDVEIVQWTTCKENYQNPDYLTGVDTYNNGTLENLRPLDITDQMLCAGLLGQGGKDSCQVSFVRHFSEVNQ